MDGNYYSVLGVESSADFSQLRKAYRARAMECHPDRFGGDVEKAEEFKLLVEAFNVLTDPVKRRSHDLELGMDTGSEPQVSFDMGLYPEDEGAIMDTLADDILEELIVGNSLNTNDTTLATMMLDLERTEIFCLFREAKTCLYRGATERGEQLFREYLEKSPVNILARYFLAKCCRANGRWSDAVGQLTLAIRIGASRHPPLQLLRMRRDLEAMRRGQPGILGFMRRIFGAPVPRPEEVPTEEAERRALNRAINRLAMQQGKRRKKLGDGR